MIPRHCLLSFVVAALLVGGCSIQPTPPYSPYATSLNENTLFMRGTFNWWGAQQAFRFSSISNNEWAVDIALVADGTVYDFKIADAAWTPEQNCGALDTRKMLTVNESVPLFCDPTSLNFQYIANTDGMYRFTLSKQEQIYRLNVRKIDQL